MEGMGSGLRMMTRIMHGHNRYEVSGTHSRRLQRGARQGGVARTCPVVDRGESTGASQPDRRPAGDDRQRRAGAAVKVGTKRAGAGRASGRSRRGWPNVSVNLSDTFEQRKPDTRAELRRRQRTLHASPARLRFVPPRKAGKRVWKLTGRNARFHTLARIAIYAVARAG
jgi:hypothetical protein